MNFPHHRHAVGVYLAQRCETHLVEAVVVLQVDEQLGRAGVRALGHRIGEEATLVALLHRIALDVGVAPHLADLGVAMDAELDDEFAHGAKERHVVEEADLDQIVKPVHAVGGPLALAVEGERADGGVEDGRELGGRLVFGLFGSLHGFVLGLWERPLGKHGGGRWLRLRPRRGARFGLAGRRRAQLARRRVFGGCGARARVTGSQR